MNFEYVFVFLAKELGFFRHRVDLCIFIVRLLKNLRPFNSLKSIREMAKKTF